MNLHNIDYLLKIIEIGNLSKATEELHISQPSLSQLIKTIERRYHTELFVRHSKPLRLTYAGEQFIDAVSRIKTIKRDLESTLENINNEKEGGGAFYTIKDAQHLRSFCLCYRKDFVLTRYMHDFIGCACGDFKKKS